MQYCIRSYKDNSGLPFFDEKYIICYYAIDGDNPIVQAYANVKTLPAFSGAVDC